MFGQFRPARANGAKGFAILLVVVAIGCLAHSVEHDALAGAHHHEEGDAAAGTIELVLIALGGALLAAVGGLYRRPSSWSAHLTVNYVPVASRSVTPKSRAGPLFLGVLRT